MASKTMKQWVVRDKGSFDSLKLEEVPIPEVGENDVLLKMHAVSLNYRDLMVATVNVTPTTTTPESTRLLLSLITPPFTSFYNGN